MTTRFEQARGRPKPPPVRSGEYDKYQREHCNTASIWRYWDGSWTAEYAAIGYIICDTFEEALETLKEIMK